jgi:hypothetical protein
MRIPLHSGCMALVAVQAMSSSVYLSAIMQCAFKQEWRVLVVWRTIQLSARVEQEP